MSPSHLAALALLAGLLGGCSYTPLALDENRPDVEDQIQEHEIVVGGESRIRFGDSSSTNCWLFNEVRGWADHFDPDDLGCSGCSEGYTLVLDPSDEGSCDFPVAGAPSIAITQLEFFPWGDYPDWVERVLTEDVPEAAAGTAVAYASTNWNPSGEADWSERLAVYELAEGPAEGFARAYYLSPFYVYSTAEGFGYWYMDLHLPE